jgi:hypothetical protein
VSSGDAAIGAEARLSQKLVKIRPITPFTTLAIDLDIRWSAQR